MNINDLLNLNGSFNYLLFDESGINIFHLTRLTLFAHQISSILKYDKEITRFKSIMYLYYWRKDRNDVPTLYVNYISTMMIYSLRNSGDWFLKAYRDFDYSPIFAEIPEHELDYFLLMLICFVINSKYTSPDNKTFIKKLVSEPKNGLNKTGSSWIETISKSIENYNQPEKLFFAIKNFLELSKKLKDNTCDIIPVILTMYSYDDNTHFSTELIIDYWLQILLYHPYFYFEKDAILNFLKTLPFDDGDIVVKVIEDRYLYYNSKIFENKSTPFFDLLFDQTTKNYNSYLMSALKDFVNFHNSLLYDKTHQPITNETLSTLKKQEDEAVTRCISLYQINKEIALNEEDVISRYIRLEGEKDDFSSLLDLYLNELEFSINELIKSYLKNNVTVNLFDGTDYPPDVIKQIIDFLPELISKHEWRLGVSRKNTRTENLNIDNIECVNYLPNGMFAKREAISFNLEYCHNLSIPRIATDEEVNKIIDSEYVGINGLYTFSQYNGSTNGSFFVTREELFAKLKDRIIIVPLVIKLAVVSKNESILYFVSKKDL